jgi:hypothetical protein
MLLGCALWLPACGPTVAATAGVSAFQGATMAYAHGRIEVVERVPLEVAYRATQRALERLNFPIEQNTLYDQVGFVTSKLESGHRVKIVLNRVSPVVTKFNIRVSVWGDESLSRLVMAYIQDEVPKEWSEPPTGGH